MGILKRPPVLMVLGALLALAALVPPRWEFQETDRIDTYTSRIDQLSRHLRATLSDLQVARLRDSLSREESLRNIAEPLAVFTRSLPEQVGNRLRGAVHADWDEALTRTGSRIIILFASSDVRWEQTFHYVFDVPEHPGTCVAAAALGNNMLEGWAAASSLRRLRDGLPGPCAFYARFGTPGPHVAAWLQATNHAAAMTPDWPLPSSGPHSPSHALTPLRGIYSQWSDGWIEFTGCAAGNLDQCRAMLWERRGLAASRAPGGSATRERWQYSPLGYNGGYYLSDLVTVMGTDRFQEFWSSSLPLADAFAASFGQSIESWTMEWARGQVTGIIDRRPFATLVMVLAMSSAFAGGGIVVAMRRQVR